MVTLTNQIIAGEEQCLYDNFYEIHIIWRFYFAVRVTGSEKKSEYDQEIPQSHNTD